MCKPAFRRNPTGTCISGTPKPCVSTSVLPKDTVAFATFGSMIPIRSRKTLNTWIPLWKIFSGSDFSGRTCFTPPITSSSYGISPSSLSGKEKPISMSNRPKRLRAKKGRQPFPGRPALTANVPSRNRSTCFKR